MSWEEYKGCHNLYYKGKVILHIIPIREFCYDHWSCKINIFMDLSDGLEFSFDGTIDEAKSHCKKIVIDRLKDAIDALSV